MYISSHLFNYVMGHGILRVIDSYKEELPQ
jgi:hypothetical protein